MKTTPSLKTSCLIWKKGTLFFLFTLFVNFLFSQTYVNTKWKQYSANPSTYDNVASALMTNGDIVTTANNLIGTATQIYINRIQNNGTMAWQQNCTGSPINNNYGSDIKTDASGNVYTCGAYHSGTNYDYRIAKYLANGNLAWQQFYNGPGNNDDIPSAIELDNAGNIYVTGSSYGLNTMTDYATLKFSNSGSQIWVSRYNFANLPDGASDILIDGSGNIFVTGSSASSFFNTDVTTVKYNSNTGAQLNVYRHNYAGNGLDGASEMSVDNSNNIIVTGTFQNGAKKFGTLKLSNSLTQLWFNTVTGTLDSEGYGIHSDNSGNVVSVGYRNNVSGGSDIIINKYLSAGILAWQKVISNPNPTFNAKARKVKTDVSGNIFVAADAQRTTRDFLTLALDANSNIKWTQYFDSPTAGTDIPNAIQILYNQVFVTGISTTGGTKQVSTVNYVSTVKASTTSTDVGVAPHNLNEFVIRFEPSMVDTTKLNNKGITYGTVSDFLTPTGVTKLDQAVGYNVDGSTSARFPAYKIHPNLTSRDSLSLSRCGNIVKLLPWYASLVITFKTGTNDTLVERKLRNAWGLTQSSDMNYQFSLDNTNDPCYVSGESAGLDATGTYSVSNINVTPAWAISSGSPNIIVGVFDTGINYTHNDFNGSGLPSSKVVTGYDYFNSQPLHTTLPPDRLGHGTGNAGLIGAIRNNSIAAVGVAGGNADSLNTGVTLHDMKCFEGNNVTANPYFLAATLAQIQQGMIDGALGSGTANIGMAQHIQNHSWGFGSNPTPQDSVIQAFKDVVRTVFQNEVVLVFSSGNNENAGFTTGLYNKSANLKDEFNLCVGGIDGTGARASFSQGGKYLDLVAPATNNLYDLLHKSSPTATTDILSWGPTNTNTIGASGTSQAAPHVSGTAALMVSYINNHPLKPNNIAPEDVEKLMEKYISPIGIPGYNAQTGWGRLNAGAIMQKIILPSYQVKHFNVNTTIANCSVLLADTLASVFINYNWMGFTGGQFAQVKRYEISYTNPHSIGTYSIIDAWKRDATSNLMDSVSVPYPGGASHPANDLPCEVGVKLLNYSNSSATLKGSIYRITQNGNPTILWFPFNLTGTNQIKLGYTLYLASLDVGLKKESLDANLHVFPNPSNEKINIYHTFDRDVKANIKLTDITGKLLYDENTTLSNNSSYSINTQNFNNGIYFVTLRLESGINKTYKQIIAH